MSQCSLLQKFWVHAVRLCLTCCRESCLDSSQSVSKEQPFHKGKSSLHSEIDETVKGQEANSRSNIKKITPNASVPKKNKLGVKEVGNSDTNCSTSKNGKNSNLNCKRKSEASTERRDGESPRKGNGSLSTPDVEIVKFVSNSVNAEATLATGGGFVDLQTSESYQAYTSSLLIHDCLCSLY